MHGARPVAVAGDAGWLRASPVGPRPALPLVLAGAAVAGVVEDVGTTRVMPAGPYAYPKRDELAAFRKVKAREEQTAHEIVRCDVCHRVVDDPGRWRHGGCRPPPLPAGAQQIIDRVRHRSPA